MYFLYNFLSTQIDYRNIELSRYEDHLNLYCKRIQTTFVLCIYKKIRMLMKQRHQQFDVLGISNILRYALSRPNK